MKLLTLRCTKGKYERVMKIINWLFELFFLFSKSRRGKAATSGDCSPCTATSSRSFVQEEGSETARAGSFTATPRSGVDSCDAVRNQLVRAAAPAELRTTGEELGNPSLKARKQADAGVRERRSRALPDRSQEGRDYKRGKKNELSHLHGRAKRACW